VRFVHLVVDGVVSNETRHVLGLVVVGELVVAEGLVVRVAQLAGDFRHIDIHIHIVLVDLHDLPFEFAEHILEPQRPQRTPRDDVDVERTIAERNSRSRLLPFFRHPGGGRGDRFVLDGIFFNCFFHGA